MHMWSQLVVILLSGGLRTVLSFKSRSFLEHTVLRNLLRFIFSSFVSLGLFVYVVLSWGYSESALGLCL